MADIGSELITYLKTKSAVTDLVGAGTAARIYEDEAKQCVALPFITIEVFEGPSEEHINAISGMAGNRIEIEVFAATKTAAYELAEVIRLAPLQMFRGEMGDTFVSSVTSNGGYEKGHDRPTTGGNQRRYWVSRDYMFRYSEPTS